MVVPARFGGSLIGPFGACPALVTRSNAFPDQFPNLFEAAIEIAGIVEFCDGSGGTIGGFEDELVGCLTFNQGFELLDPVGGYQVAVDEPPDALRRLFHRVERVSRQRPLCCDRHRRRRHHQRGGRQRAGEAAASYVPTE
jgi:hypothetical protein